MKCVSDMNEFLHFWQIFVDGFIIRRHWHCWDRMDLNVKERDFFVWQIDIFITQLISVSFVLVREKESVMFCLRLESLPGTGTTFLFRVIYQDLFDVTDITNGRYMLGLSVFVSIRVPVTVDHYTSCLLQSCQQSFFPFHVHMWMCTNTAHHSDTHSTSSFFFL